jgi:methionyl-tRNA formyltransferase
MRVKFYGEGKMGNLVLDVLKTIASVELVDEKEEDFDLLFSASCPRRISQEECKKAKFGAVNLHSGLLPRQRGYHPLNWALIWGDTQTGLTIHKIVDSFDAGDVYLQWSIKIEENDNIVSLRGKINDLVENVLKDFFSNFEHYCWHPTPQNQAEVTYAPRRFPEDSALNLFAPAEDVYNLFRACDPVEYPAFVMVDGVKRIVEVCKLVDDKLIIVLK